MTAIWFILAAMTAAAVFGLLWPMSRRHRQEAAAAALATETGFYEDQLAEIERDLARGLLAPAEAEAARIEAARRLLRASREEQSVAAEAASARLAEPHLRQRRAASAFALSTIPLVALLIYGVYGSPNLPSQNASDRAAVQAGAQGLMSAVAQIEARLATHPDDLRGWSVIAPVYMRLGRFDAAARAYAAVVRLKGEDAQALSDWGEALVAAAEGDVTPDTRKVLERAVAADPKGPKPQFYLARADEQAGDTEGAVRRLDALAQQGPADAPWMPLVRETLARLRGVSPPGSAAVGPDASRPDASRAAPGPGAAAAVQALPPGARLDAIRGMVEGLDRRLDKQGGTPEEWLRLVRSYGVLGTPDRARAALERARAALADDPQARARLDAGARGLGFTEAGAGDAAGVPSAPPLESPPPQGTAPEIGPSAGEGRPNAPAGQPATGSLDPDAAAAAVKAMPAAEREAAIRGMVAGLDRRLSAKGGSVDEWSRLVRSYGVLGDPAAAVQALERARMALAADPAASERLDALRRELTLPGSRPGR